MDAAMVATKTDEIESVRANPSGLRAFLEEAGRRIGLAREPYDDAKLRKPPLRRFLSEFNYLLEPLKRARAKPDIGPAAQPKRVMLIPGFGAHPWRMRYMAQQLERAGHRVKRWGMGYNLGPSPEVFDKLERRLERVFAKKGEKLHLVGWSLGGVYARELAKRHPDKVVKVVTLGSPFSGDPRNNNLWRIYPLVTGHAVHNPPIEADVEAKPPVETVALWSPADGIIHASCARGLPGQRDREVALRCSHMGFCYEKDSIEAIAAELDDGPVA